MIRLYQQSNTSLYKDFENHLFTTFLPIFNFANGTVSIRETVYLLDYSIDNSKIVEILNRILAAIPTVDNSVIISLLESIDTKLSINDKVLELSIDTIGQTEFVIPSNIQIIKQLLAVTGNLPLMCGLDHDYHIIGNTLFFHSYFQLGIDEKLVLIYQ